MLTIKRLYEDARLPEGNGYSLDLFCYCKSETGRPNKLLIPPRSTRVVSTGIALIPEQGQIAAITSRSSLAKERNIFVSDAPSLLDPNNRREVTVLLYNGGFESYYVAHGDRIASLIFLPLTSFELVEAD